MTDYYVGAVTSSKTFPDPSSGEDSVEGKTYAELTIEYDGKGLVLTVDPVNSKNRDNAFTCRNY